MQLSIARIRSMSKSRIAVAGAGLIGLRHIEETQKSERCTLSAIVEPSPKAAEVAQQGRRPALQVARRAFRQGPPRRRGARDAQSAARRERARVHPGRRSGAASRSRSPITVAEGLRLCEAAERAQVQASRRPSPPAQPDPAQGDRDRALGRPRADRRRNGQRHVLQARPLLRRKRRGGANRAADRSCST